MNKFNIHYVSSDKIRRELIEYYLRTNKTKSFQEAVEACGKGKEAKAYKINFNNEIQNIVINKTKINIIYVDKNFPPDGLFKFQEYVI